MKQKILDLIEKHQKKDIYLQKKRQQIIDNLRNIKTLEYKKIINLLDNTPNQTLKFMTKNWVEVNDDTY